MSDIEGCGWSVFNGAAEVAADVTLKPKKQETNMWRDVMPWPGSWLAHGDMVTETGNGLSIPRWVMCKHDAGGWKIIGCK